MGREVRMVPADWQHPKNSYGNYKPLIDNSYVDDLAEWYMNYGMWTSGYKYSHKTGWREITPEDWEHDEDYEFEECWGEKPYLAKYMPQFNDDEKTHYQMYENVTEGTPISPPMATPEELAHWLADTGASSFGRATATYEQWLAVINGGYAPSMVICNGEVKSGVEYCGKTD